MTIQVGDRLPDATFLSPGPDGPRPLATAEVFGGRTVALFAVPGAFTPTCSARHLPGYLERRGDLRERGIDQVACVAVNDVFVMTAWGQQAEVGDHVLLLADGNADFTTAIGLEQDSSRFGMGRRSKRYSMVVEDGVVRALSVEEPGDFRVSSADYMLEHMITPG